MGAGKAAQETGIGLRIVVNGKKTLAIGKTSLDVYDSALKKASRSSCAPLNGASAGQLSIPLYNVLWAEISDATLSVEYAAQPSQTTIKLEKLVYPVSSTDSEPAGTSPEIFVSTLLSSAYGESQIQKRAYVLINPSSGPGGAVKKWDVEVKPLFDAARMKMDVVTLSRGGEATELVESVDVDKYDTIVACSGDGTPHEIFNGLAKRPDARTALAKIAVSHIPCGSGNAMACNLYGSHRAAVAALAIIKGVVMPLDLVSITQGSNRHISFLSQALGIIAESDLGTENMRWMGAKRFEVGMIMRMFQRKCYPFDLAVQLEAGEKGDVRAHYKRHASETNLSTPKANGVNGVKGTNGVNGGGGTGGTSESEEGLPPLKYGTVEDELPKGWELISYDKVGNFYCGNMAYMAPDLNFFPAAAASDGCMDLVTVRGDLAPFAAAKVFTSVEAGKFFDNPDVSYRKVSAYRIIPRNQKDGYISIDGERIPFGPIQAEVHQALGRVISKRGAFEAEGPVDWEKASLVEAIHSREGGAA